MKTARCHSCLLSIISYCGQREIPSQNLYLSQPAPSWLDFSLGCKCRKNFTGLYIAYEYTKWHNKAAAYVHTELVALNKFSTSRKCCTSFSSWWFILMIVYCFFHTSLAPSRSPRSQTFRHSIKKVTQLPSLDPAGTGTAYSSAC